MTQRKTGDPHGRPPLQAGLRPPAPLAMLHCGTISDQPESKSFG